MKSGGIILMFTVFAFGTTESCVSKVYPDERLAIDPIFMTLFNSITQKDTFSFWNAVGNRKVFVITKVDSIISNEKGWFINEKPYKLLMMSFRETGKDTVDLQRSNEVFVNKDPGKNLSSMVIQFNNFFFDDTIPPLPHHDTLNLNGKKFTNYHLFETSSSLKNPNDVKVLYITLPNGFIGFKTLSGEIWVNEKE